MCKADPKILQPHEFPDNPIFIFWTYQQSVVEIGYTPLRLTELGTDLEYIKNGKRNREHVYCLCSYPRLVCPSASAYIDSDKLIDMLDSVVLCSFSSITGEIKRILMRSFNVVVPHLHVTPVRAKFCECVRTNYKLNILSICSVCRGTGVLYDA